jgi:hypothetical protein
MGSIKLRASLAYKKSLNIAFNNFREISLTNNVIQYLEGIII